MKWFFRILIGLVVTVILIPIILLLLMLDSSTPPVEVYREQEQNNVSTGNIMSQSFDAMLADSENSNLTIKFTEDELNTIIFQELKKSYPDYLINDEPENQYFQETPNYGMVGIWTKVHNDGLTLKIRANLIKPVKIKTSISLKFKLTFNDPTDYKMMNLTITSAKVGSLSLPKSLVNKVAESAGIDLKAAIEDAVKIGDVRTGVFDSDTWTLKIDKLKLAEALSSAESGAAIVTLVKILTYNKLLDAGLNKELLGAELQTSRLYLDKLLDHVPEHLRIKTKPEEELFLKSKGLNLMISALNSENGELYVNLSELDINRLLDYNISQQPLEKPIKIGGKDYEIKVLVPTIEITPLKMALNVKLELKNIENPADKFITTMLVDINPYHQDNDLQFEVGALKIGDEIQLTAEETQDLFKIFGASEFVKSNMFIINGFLLNFATNEIYAKDSETYNGYLKLIYEARDPSNNTINEIRDEIRASLEAALATNPELLAKYNEIKDKPASEVTEEEVYEFIEATSTTLSADEQEQLRQDLATALVISVPSIFDLLAS